METLNLLLKKVGGRWFGSTGKKGYRFYKSFDSTLSNWISDSEVNVSFSRERTPQSIYRIEMKKKPDSRDYIMNFFDVNTGDLKYSEEQCPNLFKDFSIDSEFYLNYLKDDNN